MIVWPDAVSSPPGSAFLLLILQRNTKRDESSDGCVTSSPIWGLSGNPGQSMVGGQPGNQHRVEAERVENEGRKG